MMVQQSVERIFTTAGEKGKMVEHERVAAIAGRGLEGDRYALGTGTYSNKRKQKIRHLTVINREAISEGNAALADKFDENETRRNIVVEGGQDVSELVGVYFYIGDVACVGVEPCLPCGLPSQVTGKEGFKDAFQEYGGVRAGIISGGEIAVGASLVIDEDQYEME